MILRRTARNAPCPCRSGKKFKHCCHRLPAALKNRLGQNPSSPRQSAAAPRDAAPPEPPAAWRVWKELHLTLANFDGSHVYLIMLHTAEWLKRHDVRVGDTIDLDLPDSGVRGRAQLGMIVSTRWIGDAEGRIVELLQQNRPFAPRPAVVPVAVTEHCWLEVRCLLTESDGDEREFTITACAEWIARNGLVLGAALPINRPRDGLCGVATVQTIVPCAQPEQISSTDHGWLQTDGKRAIAHFVVGDRVTTYTDDERDHFESGPELVPDPSFLGRIELSFDDDGHHVDIVLLRRIEWLRENEVLPGRTVNLDLPEMGVQGDAHMVAVTGCPRLRPGQGRGRLVTGTFRHADGQPGDLWLAGERKPIGVTPHHLFWSEDRQDWVSVEDLRPGERVRTLTGTTTVESYTLCDGFEPVFNLEVDGDHVFRVGELGVLVHNTSVNPAEECKNSAKNRRSSVTNENGTFEYTFDECRTTSAKGPVVFPAAKEYLSGGQRSRMSELLLGAVGSNLRDAHQAGHLIGTQFGGPGAIENLVPMPNKLNLKGGAWYRFETWLRKCLEGQGRRLFGTLHISVEYDANRCYREINIPTQFKIMLHLYYDDKKERLAQVTPYTIENKPDATFSPQSCTLD